MLSGNVKYLVNLYPSLVNYSLMTNSFWHCKSVHQKYKNAENTAGVSLSEEQQRKHKYTLTGLRDISIILNFQ